MSKYWICLLLAGLFEIGWPLGLKVSQTTSRVGLGIGAAILSMAISGYFLWIAQKQIPIGTAYAVWTGIGAAGTFILGVLIFDDPSSLLRWAGVAMIIGGVVVLKLAAH
ncbi:DMT family transporter [Cerasicoccus arenae]|uniref:Guanidinium exporter n=1 Tax=Cerasicoccus arenae TaxID=424488 RepID=A0A8J3DJL1_9BACT|nr:multidrug efflux SMR transporter [Cerasicoccus arenae]MBK1859408.1 multidrug efflux SMR transporter [Cerasicoccus arenae]GHC10823.1 QacE family quaternary ammonium compound efflux SMR transporter [Cerasicoccus arenae]